MTRGFKDDPFNEYLVKVRAYLHARDWSVLPQIRATAFHVTPLAKGEYNLNYLITAENRRFVFRVNMSSQLGLDDQIEYEFNTLKLLEESGVTPFGYFVDNSREVIDRGISIIEFLEGEHLDYHRDTRSAAATFAKIHSLQIPESRNHLIVEEQPLTLIYTECANLLEHYFNSPLAVPDISDYLHRLIDWADTERKKEIYFQNDPWMSIVNTEVNSRNFIVNRKKNITYLIDWEMPRWGDPSSDLCHFCSPLTTLWKSNYRMTGEDYLDFITSYRNLCCCDHLRKTLQDRMMLKNPFVYLRGISWSAMGWVAYQTDYQGMRDEETWKKLCDYLDLDFIRSLFDPFLGR